MIKSGKSNGNNFIGIKNRFTSVTAGRIPH